jgi:putative PIN family toxin of toxin-antitoxin system
MTRVVIDANVLISYLLEPAADRPPNQVVRAIFAREFQAFLSELTVTEILRSTRDKPWLQQHIGTETAAAFLDRLGQIASIEPTEKRESEFHSRDVDDDYLIAHALQVDADLIVTGDKDLLVLRRVSGVHVVTPKELIALLVME